eukprot:TRINITY_DN14765_c0_g1_i1.p1 TRINITY_DN14765_c0_g1~~TRINITY_DN14765_c0_g1_i1.p1  ORF type:complete len:217 (+),score=37.63 TRINITY_DN14765_c0_g1_i1:211-861(+)
MMELARDFSRQHCGWEVLGGFLSPVSDSYKKTTLISAIHRVAMVEAAVQSSPWIDISAWEAQQPSAQRSLHVLQHIQQEVRTAVGHRLSLVAEPKIRTAFVCGEDVLASMTLPHVWDQALLERLLDEHHALVVLRAANADDGSHLAQVTESLAQSPLLSRFSHHVHLIPQNVTNNVSSSLIRELVATNHSVRYLVPDAVLDYIEAQKLYQTRPEQE